MRFLLDLGTGKAVRGWRLPPVRYGWSDSGQAAMTVDTSSLMVSSWRVLFLTWSRSGPNFPDAGPIKIGVERMSNGNSSPKTRYFRCTSPTPTRITQADPQAAAVDENLKSWIAGGDVSFSVFQVLGPDRTHWKPGTYPRHPTNPSLPLAFQYVDADGWVSGATGASGSAGSPQLVSSRISLTSGYSSRYSRHRW